jgi:hypothetical protein
MQNSRNFEIFVRRDGIKGLKPINHALILVILLSRFKRFDSIIIASRAAQT